MIRPARRMSHTTLSWPSLLGVALRRACPHQVQAHAQDGFAYMWTLLLIAFMGVATLIASHAYEIGVRRDQERELLFIGHEFRSALQRYHESGQPDYPATLDDLLQDKRVPNVRRFLRRIHADPVTGKADWVLLRLNGKIVGMHSVSDKTPIKQGNFDPDDSALEGKGKYSEWVFIYPRDLVLPGEVKTADGKTEEGKTADGKTADGKSADAAKATKPEPK
jgi:hypothetical protein